MVTGNNVFEAAMALSANLVNGLAANAETAEYADRSIPLINMLGHELYQFSDTRTAAAGLRPVFSSITAMTDALNLDDGLALSVMPHGLVALLLAEDNPALANYHEQKFAEKKAQFRNVPNEWAEIQDLYGIRDYSQDAADEG